MGHAGPAGGVEHLPDDVGGEGIAGKRNEGGPEFRPDPDVFLDL